VADQHSCGGKDAVTGAILVACCLQRAGKSVVNRETYVAQPAGEFPSHAQSTALPVLPGHVSNEEVFPSNQYSRGIYMFCTLILFGNYFQTVKTTKEKAIEESIPVAGN
jgi:hypothetical protein